MSNNLPKIPIQLQIRQIIFEKFNNPELKFTNDEIFEILKSTGNISKSLTIDDMEKYFQEICDSGMVRNIAQNFTTVWFKLFEIIEKITCNSCKNQIYLAKSEARVCPNPDCKAVI